MKTIKFIKMNGAGNDFILIDAKNNKELQLTKTLITAMCDRRTGIGADGILHIEPSEKYDYNLLYYNSDGSLGSLCGNGSRCSLKYVADNYTVNNSDIKFSCNNLIYSGSIVQNDLVKFNLNPPCKIKLDFSINFNGKEVKIYFADSGSPHAVIFWDEIGDDLLKSYNNFNMKEFGETIRYAKEFMPVGTNVNLIHIEGADIYIRTYERGVEDETLACGTGAVASAIILNLVKNISSPIVLNTFGKDKLIVNFIAESEKFNKITLTGPAKINYIGSYNF